MKKWLLSFALSVGVLSATPVMAATPAFSASKMAQVKISGLNFKEVMRQFYDDQMTLVFFDESQIGNVPNVGLGQADENGYQTVALLHSIISYKNSRDETRYLVTIEKVSFHEKSKILSSCHACLSRADLYIFKKLDSNIFQLVSKSAKSIGFEGSWGRLGLDSKSLKTSIDLVGKDLVGGFVETTYKQFGFEESDWHVLHLPENNFIDLYRVGDGSNSSIGHYGEDSPLSYDYEVTIQALPQETAYYPLMLTYTGDKPTGDNERKRIRNVNYSKIKKFDPVKKEYK